jgi:hypothetical protein
LDAEEKYEALPSLAMASIPVYDMGDLLPLTGDQSK